MSEELPNPFEGVTVMTEDGRRKLAALVHQHYNGYHLAPNDPLFLILGVFEGMYRARMKQWTEALDNAVEEKINSSLEGMEQIVQRLESNVIPMLREVLKGIEAKGENVKASLEADMLHGMKDKVAMAIAVRTLQLMEKP